jgi:DNA-binding NarL/FixJ family response regulator
MPSAAHTFAVKVSMQTQKAGTTSQTSVIAVDAYDRGGLTPLFMLILLCAFLEIDEATLSSREHEVLLYLAQGKSTKVFARLCKISQTTVKVHLKAILGGRPSSRLAARTPDPSRYSTVGRRHEGIVR